jgi:cytochrome c oxidase assembly protein subunit 15
VRLDRLSRWAWWVLLCNMSVILWGAFVRASGSGAGCGNHWPMCNGQVMPRAPSVTTLIELSHRVSSGAVLILVMVLGALTFKDTAKGHPARGAAVAAMVFIWGEVFIGAGLVLLKLVAHEQSLLRGVSMELHAGNTFALLAALTLLVHYASGGRRLELRSRHTLTVPIGLAFASVALALASGAIAALGDTLFPAESLASGLAADLSPHAHLFLRLRTLHPLAAMVAAALVVLACGAVRARSASRSAHNAAKALLAATAAQVAIGVLNLALLAPIATQLLHLFMADVVFILLTLMSAHALSEPSAAADPTPSRAGPFRDIPREGEAG